MTTLSCELICPACGSARFVPVNWTPTAGNRVATVLMCAGCEREWVVTATLEELRLEGGCGTPRGCEQHYRRGEKPCEACKEARARYKNPTQRRGGRPPRRRKELVR